MADGNRIADGDKVRREVLGDQWVDPQVARAKGDPFRQLIQDYLNDNCWGYVWTRPGLPRKTRSMLNLAMLTALDKQEELKGHVRGALRNGCTREEIAEVLLHATVYAGTPCGVAAFRTAAAVFDELDGKK
jgi:4-carboxymuconolactone decarboxylase